MIFVDMESDSMLPQQISSGRIGLSSTYGWTLVTVSLMFFAAWQAIKYCQTVFRSDLRKIPGPKIAQFSAFWRPWVLFGGNAPNVYRGLHEKYGPLERTAPNVVSVSDPNAISTIYGIGSKFYKVSAH